MTESLDIGQYTGPCRRKAGNRLKQCVGIMRYVAAEDKRKCSADTDHDPNEGNADKAFFCIKFCAGIAFEVDQKADREIGGRKRKVDQSLSFPVDKSRQRGKKEKDGFKLENQPCGAAYD